MVIGVLFLLDNFYIIDFGDAISTYWPVILIAIGIKILMDKNRQKSNDDVVSISDPLNTKSYTESNRNKISENNVFGDIQLKIDSESFDGGSLSNVFGDIRLDLSGVKLTQEITKIHISGVFGDVTIVTPQDVPLMTRSSSVAGDISVRGNKKEGLFPKVEQAEDTYETSNSKLFISVSIVFGSINIY